MTRAIVAQFHKSPSGRLRLWQLTTITDGYRKEYDVEWSRRYGYIFHQSAMGGVNHVTVNCIYFVSGYAEVKEQPCQLGRNARSKQTKVIRALNKTRRLRALPKAFELEPRWDLLDWLERNAIEEDAVYCSICRDWMPATGFDYCEHVWWCDKAGCYSTPTERCKCKDQDECYG